MAKVKFKGAEGAEELPAAEAAADELFTQGGGGDEGEEQDDPDDEEEEDEESDEEEEAAGQQRKAAQAPAAKGAAKDPAADLFDEEDDAGGKKGHPPLHQQRRFQKVQEARRAAEERATKAEQERDRYAPIGARVDELYGWARTQARTKGIDETKGVLEAIAWDTTFVETLVQLESTDPEAKRVVNKVMASMNKAAANVPGATQTTAGSLAAQHGQGAAAQRDPLVQKMAERDARAEVISAMSERGITQKFAKLIAADFVATHRSKLGELDIDEELIAEHAKGWIAKHEFTKEELTGKPAKKGAAPNRATLPGSQRAAAAAEDEGEDEEQEESEAAPRPKPGKAPKNLKEWKANHERMVRRFVRKPGRATA